MVNQWQRPNDSTCWSHVSLVPDRGRGCSGAGTEGDSVPFFVWNNPLWQLQFMFHVVECRASPHLKNIGEFINFDEIKEGEIYKFCGSRGEYTICITDLGGMIFWSYMTLVVILHNFDCDLAWLLLQSCMTLTTSFCEAAVNWCFML